MPSYNRDPPRWEVKLKLSAAELEELSCVEAIYRRRVCRTFEHPVTSDLSRQTDSLPKCPS